MNEFHSFTHLKKWSLLAVNRWKGQEYPHHLEDRKPPGCEQLGRDHCSFRWYHGGSRRPRYWDPARESLFGPKSHDRQVQQGLLSAPSVPILIAPQSTSNWNYPSWQQVSDMDWISFFNIEIDLSSSKAMNIETNLEWMEVKWKRMELF